ncbi:hypothetical protein TD95_001440 [Thielaviopsis punctulata]|uniref:Metallo-beta-lactamase domain-containing protein n=1 Tax=Thielaviopsis punctulata TaxID=72032 RepID=A0A0F4ZBQ9_9PEZI|nr:hypothetical protein TD95_001440 [Thielaviopsis punctulata]
MPLTPPSPSTVLTTATPTPNILTLSLPFLRFSRLPIGGRATVARLPNASLAVFSPIAYTGAVRAALAAFAGSPAPRVAYIVAPDIEHHLFLSAWKEAFPDAKVLGPAGLPEKRASSASAAAASPPPAPDQDAASPRITDIPFDTVFSPLARPSVDPLFDSAFSCEFVHAHANREIVFLHRHDRALIQADLLFNLPATEQYARVPPAEYASLTSGFNGLLYSAFAAFNHMGVDGRSLFLPRVWQYYIAAKDRKAYRESIRRIAEWDFDSIIPCHGDVITTNGKYHFEQVMKWYLDKDKNN